MRMVLLKHALQAVPGSSLPGNGLFFDFQALRSAPIVRVRDVAVPVTPPLTAMGG